MLKADDFIFHVIQEMSKEHVMNQTFKHLFFKSLTHVKVDI